VDSEKGFRGLTTYQKAYELVKEIYKLSRKLPDDEKYNINTQIKRAATSIPLNIAEGYGRKESNAEYKRFLIIAKGSNNELQVLLELCKDFSYITEEKYIQLIARSDEIGRMISGLIASCRDKKPNT